MIKTVLLEKILENNYLAKYYLCEEKSSYGDKILFGIEIELYSDDKKFKTVELVRKITESRKIVLEMINLMAEKDVTPNSLFYVVDEIYNIVNKKLS